MAQEQQQANMFASPVYKRGSRGSEVGNIQKWLGDYYTKYGDPVDNIYGRNTASAVRDWQAQWNLDHKDDNIGTPDGIVGRLTYPRLKQWYAERQAAGNQPAAATTPSQPTVAQQPAPVAQNDGAKGILPGNRELSRKQDKPITTTEDLAAALARTYTTPEEEERQRKATVMNQRILAIGDALRHIGNIANTVGYAPAQQLNNPVQEEQARYERGKALRDKANQQYYVYQQQKAAQDAANRKWEQEFGLRQKESDARANLNEARLQRQQALLELDEARRLGQISDNEYKAMRNKYYPEYRQSQIDKNNRSGYGRSGGGRGGRSTVGGFEEVSESWKDDRGVTHRRKTKTPTGTYDQQGKKKIGLRGQGNNGKKIGLKK